MNTKMTVLLFWVLYSGLLMAGTRHQSQVEVNVNLAHFPIQMTADWSVSDLSENTVVFDFQPGICAIDAVRVNGVNAQWNQSGNQLIVEVDTPASPTVISFDWHAAPDSQSDSIRKRDTEDTHSITAISTPFGTSRWMPVPSGFEACFTGEFSFVMSADMDGVATGSRISDTVVAEGHCVRFEITNPVFPRQLFFSMASGREIETTTLSTLSGDRPLTTYPYPGLKQECETDLAPISTLVPMLEQWFGTFPDTADHIFSACVMDFDQVVAVPGILALGQGFITGEGTIDNRLANGLAGQWWGYRFPVHDPAHFWVTEGLRTYSEILVETAETSGTEESQVNFAADILQNYDLGGTTLEGPLIVTEGNPYDHPYVLTAKGAYTLHMLRTILEDGLFFSGLKQLPELNSHSSATNRLRFALEKETRFPVGSFLQQWTTRSPRPVLSYRFDQTGDRLILDISQADPEDGGDPFQLPLQIVQGEDTTIVWLTEKNQRFFLHQSIGMPELDPHSHTLKLAISGCQPLSVPDLDFSISTDNTTYPFRLVPNFSQLPEGTCNWRVDGSPVTPTADGNIRVREPGIHIIQLTVSSPEQTPVSQVLAVHIPQPDGDVNGDEAVDAGDLTMVLGNDTADPIPNGIRDEGDISYLVHLLLKKIRDGDTITPEVAETTTQWQMELQADSTSVATGYTVSLNLNIHGPSNLQLAVVKLEFDPKKLEPILPEAVSGVRILFSSVTNGIWTLVLGCADTGFDCTANGGKVVSTIRFRVLKDGGTGSIQTDEETCIFSHEDNTALLPSATSTELSFSSGTIQIPLVLNTDKWETSLGLIQTGDSSDDILLTALDNYGNTIATDSLTLEPGHRLLRKVVDFFGDLSTIASVRITGLSTTRVWVQYRNLENTATAACPASIETESSLFVPHLAENNYWNTLSGIVNRGNIALPLTFSAAGNEIIVNENTPPGAGYHGRFIDLLDETFLQGGWGIFNGNNMPLAGAELFYRVDSLHQAAALSLSDKTACTFYFPHIAINGFWWTGISLINPGNEAAIVTMEAFDSDGHAILDINQTTGTTTFSLPEQTRRVDLVENFFDNRLDPRAAWIRVTSDKPVTGLEIFGSRAGFQEDLSAGLEAVSEPSVSMIFPWATDGENQQWCGLALLNPDETNPADDITVTLFTEDGTTVGLAALHLDPLQKHVVLIRDLFGGTVPTGGAYLRVQSDMPLVGFELTGDDNHQWLMGLNGM